MQLENVISLAATVLIVIVARRRVSLFSERRGSNISKPVKIVMAIVTVISFLILLTGSPEHAGEDEMFWWLLVTALGLAVLCVLLYNESDQSERDISLRLFFQIEALLIAAFAAITIVRLATHEKLW